MTSKVLPNDMAFASSSMGYRDSYSGTRLLIFIGGALWETIEQKTSTKNRCKQQFILVGEIGSHLRSPAIEIETDMRKFKARGRFSAVNLQSRKVRSWLHAAGAIRSCMTDWIGKWWRGSAIQSGLQLTYYSTYARTQSKGIAWRLSQ